MWYINIYSRAHRNERTVFDLNVVTDYCFSKSHCDCETGKNGLETCRHARFTLGLSNRLLTVRSYWQWMQASTVILTQSYNHGVTLSPPPPPPLVSLLSTANTRITEKAKFNYNTAFKYVYTCYVFMNIHKILKRMNDTLLFYVSDYFLAFAGFCSCIIRKLFFFCSCSRRHLWTPDAAEESWHRWAQLCETLQPRSLIHIYFYEFWTCF